MFQNSKHTPIPCSRCASMSTFKLKQKQEENQRERERDSNAQSWASWESVPFSPSTVLRRQTVSLRKQKENIECVIEKNKKKKKKESTKMKHTSLKFFFFFQKHAFFH